MGKEINEERDRPQKGCVKKMAEEENNGRRGDISLKQRDGTFKYFFLSPFPDLCSATYTPQ